MEFMRHYNLMMNMFGATQGTRFDILKIALKGEALYEYATHVESNVEHEGLSASKLIEIVGRRLESSEFITGKRNTWTDLTFNDQTFRRLRLQGIRLHKILRGPYLRDEMLSDFLRRATKDERFWTWIMDYDNKIVSDKLCGMITNAISR